MMQRLLLRVIITLCAIFTLVISSMLVWGRTTDDTVFIYQQGYGHASLSYILDLQTQYQAPISNQEFASYPAFSPNGKYLAYFVYGDDALSLRLANRNTASDQLLLDNVTIANVLSWSPNSDLVAIMLSDDSLSVLGVLDIESGNMQRVDVNDIIREVLWFSDTELLIMTDFIERNRDRNYYHYDLNSETLTLLDDLTHFIDIDLSSDKQQIIGTDSQGNLWLWQMTTNQQTLITTHGAIINNPTFSGDGNYISYNVALGNGLHGLYIYSMNNQQENEILRGIGRIFSILFLPDNRLLFTRGDVTERTINLINLDGSALQTIATDTSEISGHLIWRP